MKNEIIKLSQKLGIEEIGFVNIKDLSISYDKYDLQEKLDYKCSFQVGNIKDKDLSSEKYSEFNSVIVILIPYKKQVFKDDNKVYMSSCAVGRDYHILVKERLEQIGLFLESNGFKYKSFVDNNSLDERALAYNAGLGFYGKNNLLINEKFGSYFYIGEILTDAVFESDKPINKSCIGCDKCIESCPTKALNKNGILNSKRCLSYLTQSKSLSEEDYKYFNNCIYGCDKCISVCPYNNHVEITECSIEPNEFLEMTEEEFKNKYQDNASAWRGKKTLDRNINIYLNNLKNDK